VSITSDSISVRCGHLLARLLRPADAANPGAKIATKSRADNKTHLYRCPRLVVRLIVFTLRCIGLILPDPDSTRDEVPHHGSLS